MTRRCALAIAVAALHAAGALGACTGAAGAPQLADIKRDDLVVGVEVTGVLEAVDSTDIKPPPLPGVWNFKIANLAVEGQEIKPGDPVIGFDASDQVRELETMQNEAAAAQTKLAKKRDDAQLASRDDELKIAEAEANLRKATLKTDAPPDLVAQVQQREVELDEQAARVALDAAKQHAEQTRRSDAEEIQRLTEKASYARQRVAQLQKTVASLQVAAPRAGTVVYPVSENGEKHKVGDSVWRMEDVIQIVGLGHMLGNGQVDEVDMARLADRQPVVLRLDAMPDVQLRGAVQSIARSVQARSNTDPSKIVKLKIAIDPTPRPAPPRDAVPRRGRDRAPARRGPDLGRRRVRDPGRAGRVPPDRRRVRAGQAGARPPHAGDDRGQGGARARRSGVAQRSGGDAVKRALIAIAVLATLGVTTARLLRGAAARRDGVATYTVARERFVRRVTAEGNLRAVNATRLTAPRASAQRGPLKIAWLAPDGSLVKKGEVVVRFDPSDPEKQLRDGQADLESASSKLRQETVKSSAAVADRDTDAVLARDELDQTRKFQSKDQMIFSRNQIIESEIDEHLAGARQAHAETRQADRAPAVAVERRGDRGRAPEGRAGDRARPGGAPGHGAGRAG